MSKKDTFKLYCRMVKTKDSESENDFCISAPCLTLFDESNPALLEGTSPNMMDDKEYLSKKILPSKGQMLKGLLHDTEADKLLKGVYEYFQNKTDDGDLCVIDAIEVEDNLYDFFIDDKFIMQA